MDFAELTQHCAPAIQPVTMAAIARVESSFNPFAIGVVNGRLVRQPVTREEAVATAVALERGGYNFSVGISQVNIHNLSKVGLDYESAFDSCSNLRAGAAILADCYSRAKASRSDEQQALRAALSCYCSGNFSTGFRAGYVAKVVANVRPTSPQVAVSATPVFTTGSAPSPPHSLRSPSTATPVASTSLPPAAPAASTEPQSALLF